MENFQGVEFYDYSPEFFSSVDDDDIMDELWDVEFGNWVAAPNNISPNMNRMDWCLLTIFEDGVWWKGKEKFSNYTIETSTITWHTIKTAAGYSTCKCGHDQLDCDKFTKCKMCGNIGCWDSNSKPLVKDLKNMNSRPDATECFKCGSHLKEPYPGIKFCSICEN